MDSNPDVERERRLCTFKAWFQGNGGSIHPCASLSSDGENTCLRASDYIGRKETIVTCPFSLVITTEAAERALTSLCGLSSDVQAQFSARQRICIYINLHWTKILNNDTLNTLRHGPYIDILPPQEQLLTPLFFSESELDMFKGTNLYQATHKLRYDLKSEFEAIYASINGQAPETAQALTVDKYMLAAAYLNSRAFPSTLLSAEPSLLEKPGSYAVLIPGLDSTNHAPGHPITLTVVKQESQGDGRAAQLQDLSIGFVSETETLKGDEVLNNYGPKPNASLISGYGFAIPQNQHDTMFLKVGVGASAPQSSVAQDGRGEHELGTEIGRSATGLEKLWVIVRDCCADDEEFVSPEDDCSAAVKEFTRDMAALDMLQEMVETLQDRLEGVSRRKLQGLDAVRDAKIEEMHRHYLSGQLDITRDIRTWLAEKERVLSQRQEELGVVFEDDDFDGS